MQIDFLVLLLGAGIGVISALLGLGGGVLIIPLLPVFTTLSHHEVIGTSLFTILLVVINNTIKFHRNGLIHWRLVSVLGPLAAVSAYAAANFGLQLDAKALKITLIFVYIVMAIWTFLVTQSKQVEKQRVSKDNLILLFLFSGLAGMISGLTGIGSGLILGGILLNLKVLPNISISPASNAIMVFTCLFGVMPYLFSSENQRNIIAGNIDLKVSLLLFIGAFSTSHFARKHQHKINPALRRKIIGFLLISLAIKVYLSL